MKNDIMMQLTFKPYLLQLSHVFRISTGARSEAPIMLTCISFEGFEGYGEASVPALYGESLQSVTNFLLK
ncbi:MAG TPA: hypothetical protein VK982_04100 [Bacteroidales bacterium]|nr:hypothetical protein [Bacteroidales bacterium]